MRLEPPSWWYGNRIPPAAWGLLPASLLYGWLAERRFHKADPYRSGLPVICVGNFTLGGAGKTPVALKLAGLLRDKGRMPAFLTRGYGGREYGPHVVDPSLDTAEAVGDEPLLLARVATTVVSRNRPAGAKLLESLGADTIVMDDGFQNPSLEKDFNLIVVDAGAGVGSGHVFPLGPLRAPLGFQASMADAILILGTGGAKASIPPELEETVHSRLVFAAEVKPVTSGIPSDRPFLAFCGIGRPAKFFDTLREAGIRVLKSRIFPDHNPYTEADAAALLTESKALNAALLTTEKDLVRLAGKTGARADLYRSAAALPITIEFHAGDESRLMQSIDPILQSRIITGHCDESLAARDNVATRLEHSRTAPEKRRSSIASPRF
jgi:tetraacyldisaccharide 4'-kinase